MNTQILTAILSKDSKDATYKYALLRAMVQCVTDQGPHKGKADNGWISYPFGLLIYYWVLFYYPIFAHKDFIPQKNGETPELRKGRTIAFRREFNKVIEYYRNRGGFPQFRFDLIHDQIPDGIQRGVILLLRKIQHTIKGMPMKHLGYYEFKKHYSLVNYDTRTISTSSYYGLIKESGRFFILPALHKLFDEIGALIIGQDSIINGWAEFTTMAAQRAEGVEPVSKEKVLTVLTSAVDVPRDISQVKRILKETGKEDIRCIWTGVRLSGRYHIDHAMPYTLWQNNNLWNLVPVKAAINLKKSDKIPSPDLIEESSERIKIVWRLYAMKFGRQFEREIFEGLGTDLDNDMNDAIHALKNKSEYLIEKRGFQKFELS
ncbi:MAG: HNH endonuclease domain-containing protein [Balneolaceae bacterium]